MKELEELKLNAIEMLDVGINSENFNKRGYLVSVIDYAYLIGRAKKAQEVLDELLKNKDKKEEDGLDN